MSPKLRVNVAFNSRLLILCSGSMGSEMFAALKITHFLVNMCKGRCLPLERCAHHMV